MRTRKPRFTIERIRTLVLVAGCLVVVALIVFLGVGRWRSRLNLREIPKKLGINIQQEANGVTYTQASGGHTLFKIHASKVVQLKQGGKALLHDVQIELYGDDGKRVDRIAGDEFEYDQKEGRAVAAGPVEITLMQPGQSASSAPGSAGPRSKGTVLANATQDAAQGEIHVKTSGLTFDQKSGLAATPNKVDFSVRQGSGSSIGATFDSDKGLLVLNSAVQLDLRRGRDLVVVHAAHAEFERGDLICRMKQARAEFRGGDATAGDATLLFRSDGSAVRLEAADGLSLKSPASGLLSAPRGTLDFNERSQPRQGRMEGGVTLQSERAGRALHATSPTAALAFSAEGELKHAHLERGVAMHSEETSTERGGSALHVVRDWRSPVADLDFRNAVKGHADLASVHGSGGVVVTGEDQAGSGPVAPSRLVADEITGVFGADKQLSSLASVGRASLEQTSATGTRQTIAGDRIDAGFAVPADRALKKGEGGGDSASRGSQIASATVVGNVSLTQVSPAKAAGTAPAVMHATAGRAVYDGAGEWLHLMSGPRVDDGQLQLTAEKIDVSRTSGDAFAHGNVKATWLAAEEKAGGNIPPGGSAAPSLSLGSSGPAHLIATEAQLKHSSGEAIFHGNVRMWQQANSITAPEVVLDRGRQTLTAHGNGAVNPVKLVFLSSGGGATGPAQGAKADPGKNAKGPTLIRVRGGDFKYSEGERKALMRSGSAGPVEAETGSATSESASVELLLLPAHNHALADGSAGQVDKVVAAGGVSVTSMGRHGVGNKLVYSSAAEEYTLTGTASDPPRMTEPGRGTVSGDSLIFNTRDGSVSIEGDGHKTTTETSAPH